MKKNQNIYATIENFFFKEDTRGEFLVFFRMAVGCVALLHFLAIIQDFDLLFSSKSLVPQDIMAVFHPDWLISLPKIVSYFESIGIQEATTLLAAKAAYITFCVLIIVGLFSRFAASLLLLLQIAVLKGGSFFVYGVDFFTSMSLFYLVLFPSDNYFSLRNYFAKRQDQLTNLTPIKRLFQVHISIAYFFSGFDKLLGYNWHNGESIWKAINLPYANHDFFFDFSVLANYSFVLVAAGWVTILTEMLYPLFVWIPKTRRAWLMATIGMHVGIALILNLYYFSAIMIVWNLSNFYFETNSEQSFSFSLKKIKPVLKLKESY